MAKVTIEIEDDLQERIDSCVEELLEKATKWVKENPDHNCTDGSGLLSELDYDGTVHECIDSSVPIYHYNINSLWYLYESEFTQSYSDQMGERVEEDDTQYKQACIYLYLSERVHQAFDELPAVEILLEEKEDENDPDSF